MTSQRRYHIGVDTGGTFTDLVLLAADGGERRMIKVASTPENPALAVLEAVRRTGAADETSFFVLGTTVATNALLQRTVERTTYLTTEGFQDVPFIQRINRLGLYDLQWVKPAPYVRRADCLGVRERVAFDGSVRVPLEDAEIERVLAELCEREGAIAINFLFSFMNPSHERRLADAIREVFPDRAVSLSSSVAPIWREYERANTVIVDASLKRLIASFAAELDEGLEEIGLHCPRFFLKSNGGQVRTGAAARRPVDVILSGLAGGLIAGRHYAALTGFDAVATLDMGGTSADVGLVLGGVIRSSNQYEFEFGLPIVAPVVDMTTVGAGGSSIAELDPGGLLRVGPASAGATPGPACYGRGGTKATITDANVVLGRLDPGYFLGGELPLEADRARAALTDLANGLGISVEEAAQAVVEVSVENMANAMRLLCADRGLDYRSLDLMAFGGAGPLHGALVAQRLGLRRVVVPPEPGLASAFGALVADLRVDRHMTRAFRSDVSNGEELRKALESLAAEALADLEKEGEAHDSLVTVSADCRYLGQNYDQEIPLPLDAPADLLALAVERFHRRHEATYGYRLDDAIVEIVSIAAVAIAPSASAAGPVHQPAQADEEELRMRSVYFKERGWVETRILRRDRLRPGSVIEGPAIIEEPDSTVLVPPGSRVHAHDTGVLMLELGEPASGTDDRLEAVNGK
jgi:N-methylhydantoinase A